MNLEAYDDEYLVCRELRSHAWYPMGWDERPGTFGVARVWECARCGTERQDIYGTWGMKVSRPRYKYPDGYRPARGESIPTRDEWRHEAMRRAGVSVDRSGKVIPLRKRKRSA